jgi:hypothetical protein
MTRTIAILTLLLLASAARPAFAQVTATVQDISPDNSTLDATDPDGASGGRVNGIGVARQTPGTFYAASEWGGLFRSTDNGLTWAHVEGHVPTVTWDVEVDPQNTNRVYATSFYDGRVNSRSGINVSTDGGITWTHPATATPPANFCLGDARRNEPAAFGIAIDPANNQRVFIGTNCGLAISSDAGVTWTFVDPTPATRADDVWDVVVHHGGIIDVCGDDGHLRSTNGGGTWTTAATVPLQQGQCSIAVSPDEDYVLFAVVGTTIFESDDGGQSWPITYANPSAQGRIPFVATNQRTGATYDLWFGDVRLHRGTCTTPSPAAPGGAQRCNGSGAWAGPFTRTVGGHDDTADIAFTPGVLADACPVLFSSDGGVYRNTVAASPACHTPAWEQPNVTPHALWSFTFSGAQRPGAQPEDLYFGNQDNGSFGTTTGGAPTVAWRNERCCDGFDSGGDNVRAMTTICCFGGGRATRLFVSSPGLTGASPEINTYPPGNMRSFEHLEAILNFGPDDYLVSTTSGVFVTLNVGASPVVWTQLGATNSPFAPCGLQVSFAGGTPTFFTKSGGCNGDAPGAVWRHQGTAAGGTWQQVPAPPGGGGFGVYAVDRNNPQRIIASQLRPVGGPRMVMSLNGGANWNPIPALDLLMTGNGTFQYQNQRGATVFTGFNGYPQPTLVAFDPADPDIIVAGGADSGVFISVNGGTRWHLVTDPIAPGVSGVPHIPRPYYSHFDHDQPSGNINLYLGTRGRGAWRLTFQKVDVPEIQVPSPPRFTASCLGDQQPGTLKICNTSTGNLVVSAITSSNPEFVVRTPSGGFPVTISHDFCFPFEIEFTPTAPGVRTATLTSASNDPNFPTLTVSASGTVGQPTIVTMIADTGNFGQFCPGPQKFRDKPLTINNRGACPLFVNAITSSSPAFQSPQVLSFPLRVESGTSVEVPIRFQPTTAGPVAATMTLTTNDPAAASKIVNVNGSAPESYVCQPPVFTSIDSAVGPAFGTGQTGGYTVNGSGHFLGSFGESRRFAVQADGEYMFFPGRQEGQIGAALIYRRGILQFGFGGNAKRANIRAETFPGAVSEAMFGVDVLLPTIRFGLFGSKGLRETDIVGSTEVVGSLGAPTTVIERVLHTVDSLGVAVQTELVPLWWFDANLAFLNRHAPGASNTAGAAARVSRQLLPWLVGTVQLDVNESFVSSNNVGTVTFGVRIGRRSQPQDYANPVNPLGFWVPRVHYEVFDRTR